TPTSPAATTTTPRPGWTCSPPPPARVASRSGSPRSDAPRPSAHEALMGQTLVVGIISGGIYGLMAVGLVLVFKGTRVLNFAQVEVGTLSLYAAYEVTTQHGAPWIVGASAAVVLALAIGLLFERLIVRPMGDAPRVTVAVATIG